jgi:hypothetical protein
MMRWLAAWPGAALIGVANGAIREGTYGRQIDQQTAHRLSGISLAAALGAYFWNLHRRWPIPSGGDAARVGAAWVGLTVAFEFGLGRRVERRSWSEMLAAYNLAKGQTWPLVLAWIGIGPAVVRRLQRDRRGRIEAPLGRSAIHGNHRP